MTLTVLSVGYPFAPAGIDAVGGAEQVMAAIDSGLQDGGHRSIVVANAGSRIRGVLIGTDVPAGPITQERKAEAWAAHRRNVERVMKSHRIDVVHMHGIDFQAYLPPPGRTPVLVTLHLPPSWYAREVFDHTRADVHLHCVSRSQERNCPMSARLLPAIGNGVPVRALSCACAKRRFAVSLGRICPEKNPHVALEAGRRAGVPVLLGGQVFPYELHERYFHEQVVPRLDRLRRFIGAVAFARKRRLLAAARCLLAPTLAPETSSLVAMEALACGTPVIAFPSGALVEIVEDGVTGFLVRDAAEMADAIEACGALDPERCRATARERFSARQMVREYINVYGQLAART